MPQTPRKSARGLFASGLWHCDCTPRLPAEHFKVRKDGKNHGRWFYTCQKPQHERCGFFLWDEDAKPREESAVLGNSRTEKVEKEANPEWMKEQERLRQMGKKRMVEETQTLTEDDDDDETISWPATAEQQQQPETPSKRQKTGVYATPSTTKKRTIPWHDVPEIDTPSKKTVLLAVPPPPPEEAPISPPETGKRSPPIIPQAESGDRLLTADVLSVLSGHAVSLTVETQRALREVLGKHELRLLGAVKGRELVRAGLRGRDARIVELSARLAGVEAERDVLRRSLAGRVEREVVEIDGEE